MPLGALSDAGKGPGVWVIEGEPAKVSWRAVTVRRLGDGPVLPHMRAQRQGRIVNVSSVLGFLPAPYMGLYSASKHAVEGLSETLDHEVRQFGVRVTLVAPSFTKTNLEANSPRTKSTIAAYDNECKLVAGAVADSVNGAPEPSVVAGTIVDAALGAWRMRRIPAGQASLLSKLRRFLPAGPVDASLRKTLGLA